MITERLEEKLAHAANGAAKKTMELAIERKTNLCLALDVTTTKEFDAILKAAGEEILVLKTHVDVVEDYSPEWVGGVRDYCNDHGIVIFEDRKFADIGTTVKLQYAAGIYKIANWAEITNCHAVPGDGVIEGLETAAKEKADGKPRGCLILAQMSSKGTLATGQYTTDAVEMAKRHPDFCAGFIGNGAVPEELRKLAAITPQGMLLMTPGVQLGATEGKLGQRYSTPKAAVEAGSDVIIVGNGIYKAADPAAEARKYQNEAWV